ncbi:LOW QUALITY PROTEIN: origin recognition complex subunit 3 N-terminus-domain-containing protein [Endogone sp. FLAS-F59071]|nr:LOW QUALITY PROTEIN: origin recognition complex subunit 3 N-terminus-domain-containing protein [Endogone sp. FLAS-F59071]|eukprot:RUS17934.1 LOW QUALITY PROTEIN: origin recognition complex subunit 3 N-terminus-domain-containing protein [Endogone sp. FLAS-F59071]
MSYYSISKSASTQGCRLPNYDMQVLEGWYQHIVNVGAATTRKRKHGDMNDPTTPPRPNLVVILQDFESFEPTLLQDFITICSEYHPRLPIILLVGIATSAETLHQALPKSALSLLRTEKFHLQRSDRWFSDVVEELFIKSPIGLKLGPKPYKFLLDHFVLYDFSMGSVVATLKYAVMHHFYANPLSIFTNFLSTADLHNFQTTNIIHPSHIDLLRMLPSFRRHIDTLSNTDPGHALDLLDNDPTSFLAALPTQLRALHDYHVQFRVGFALLVALQSCFAAYPALRKSKRMLYLTALEESQGLKGSDIVKWLTSLVGKMNFEALKACLQRLVEGLRDVMEEGGGEKGQETGCDVETMVRRLEGYQAKLETIKSDVTEDNKEEEEGTREEEDVEAGGSTSNGMRKLMKLSENKDEMNGGKGRQTKVSIRLKIEEEKEALKKAPKEVRDYKELMEAVQAFVVEMLERSLFKYTTLPFHEIVYYSNVKLHEKTFTAQPRATIQTALAQPAHYLNCDCCRQTASDALSPTQHDTCILYKLYLECNRMINMYDWFVAFGVVLERETRDGKGKIEEREVQARFIRSVAELQFLGFVKPTNRKTDHVVRLTWMNV